MFFSNFATVRRVREPELSRSSAGLSSTARFAIFPSSSLPLSSHGRLIDLRGASVSASLVPPAQFRVGFLAASLRRALPHPFCAPPRARLLSFRGRFLGGTLAKRPLPAWRLRVAAILFAFRRPVLHGRPSLAVVHPQGRRQKRCVQQRRRPRLVPASPLNSGRKSRLSHCPQYLHATVAITTEPLPTMRRAGSRISCSIRIDKSHFSPPRLSLSPLLGLDAVIVASCIICKRCSSASPIAIRSFSSANNALSVFSAASASCRPSRSRRMFLSPMCAVTPAYAGVYDRGNALPLFTSSANPFRSGRAYHPRLF